ncbi:MAG: alpha/beta fold hydrolase [Betaproteobacteria bacterium]|nr:alpha/beta fold hydrolase [Betaproteobacteria bacterium]
MKPYLAMVCVALAGAVLHGTAHGAKAPRAPRVEPVAPCFVVPAPATKVDYRYDCGYVVVPENRAIAGGRTVKLGFLRLRARTQTREPPLFMLAGGPGGSLIVPSLFDLFQPEFLGSVLDRRDVVVLDQRGTRHTVPHLDCPGFHALSWRGYDEQLSAEARSALERRLLERCVDGFRRQGIDLSQYNSVALAADVDDARRALGYRRIFYYGASYGSQLGQHVMRDFPAMLDGVILDGTSALSRKSWVEDRAIDVEFSLRQLDTLCREDEKCRAAFDVPALIEKGLSLFEAGPIKASFVDPKAPDKTYPIEVTRDDFAAMVYEKLGYKIGVLSLPYFLELLAKDGRASMGQGLAQWRGERLLAARDAPGGELATVMYMAVVCSDDPVRSPAEVIREGAGKLPLLFADTVAQELVRMCETVEVPSLPGATDVNVESDIPTLILSGRLDAQTPTFRSQEVAGTLRSAQLVVFPDGTHVQVGAVNTCAMKIIAQFLKNPRAKVATDCLRDRRLPGFVLPDGTISRQ